MASRPKNIFNSQSTLFNSAKLKNADRNMALVGVGAINEQLLTAETNGSIPYKSYSSNGSRSPAAREPVVIGGRMQHIRPNNSATSFVEAAQSFLNQSEDNVRSPVIGSRSTFPTTVSTGRQNSHTPGYISRISSVNTHQHHGMENVDRNGPMRISVYDNVASENRIVMRNNGSGEYQAHRLSVGDSRNSVYDNNYDGYLVAVDSSSLSPLGEEKRGKNIVHSTPVQSQGHIHEGSLLNESLSPPPLPVSSPPHHSPMLRSPVSNSFHFQEYMAAYYSGTPIEQYSGGADSSSRISPATSMSSDSNGKQIVRISTDKAKGFDAGPLLTSTVGLTTQSNQRPADNQAFRCAEGDKAAVSPLCANYQSWAHQSLLSSSGGIDMTDENRVSSSKERLSIGARLVDKDTRLVQSENEESSDDTQRLRRLSQELYSGMRFGGRRKSGTGETVNQKLGSISETKQFEIVPQSRPSFVGSQHEMDTTRWEQVEMKITKESPGDKDLPVEDEDCVDDDENPPNGTNFVRNNKAQMSLRKAFGIFEEFDDLERKQRTEVRKDMLPSPTTRKNLAKTSQAEHGVAGNQADDSQQVVRPGKMLPRKSLDSAKLYTATDAKERRLSESMNSRQDNKQDTVLMKPELRQKAVSLPRQITDPYGQLNGQDIRSSKTSLVVSSNFSNPRSSYSSESTADSSVTDRSKRSNDETISGQVEIRNSKDYQNNGSSAPRGSGISGSHLLRGRTIFSHSPASQNSSASLNSSQLNREESLLAPSLPPRLYRVESVTGATAVMPPVSCTGVTMATGAATANDEDYNSTLKQDAYAKQLRKNAARLSSQFGGFVTKPGLVSTSRSRDQIMRSEMNLEFKNFEADRSVIPRQTGVKESSDDGDRLQFAAQDVYLNKDEPLGGAIVDRDNDVKVPINTERNYCTDQQTSISVSHELVRSPIGQFGPSECLLPDYGSQLPGESCWVNRDSRSGADSVNGFSYDDPNIHGRHGTVWDNEQFASQQQHLSFHSSAYHITSGLAAHAVTVTDTSRSFRKPSSSSSSSSSSFITETVPAGQIISPQSETIPSSLPNQDTGGSMRVEVEAVLNYRQNNIQLSQPETKFLDTSSESRPVEARHKTSFLSNPQSFVAFDEGNNSAINYVECKEPTCYNSAANQMVASSSIRSTTPILDETVVSGHTDATYRLLCPRGYASSQSLSSVYRPFGVTSGSQQRLEVSSTMEQSGKSFDAVSIYQSTSVDQSSVKFSPVINRLAVNGSKFGTVNNSDLNTANSPQAINCNSRYRQESSENHLRTDRVSDDLSKQEDFGVQEDENVQRMKRSTCTWNNEIGDSKFDKILTGSKSSKPPPISAKPKLPPKKKIDTAVVAPSVRPTEDGGLVENKTILSSSYDANYDQIYGLRRTSELSGDGTRLTVNFVSTDHPSSGESNLSPVENQLPNLPVAMTQPVHVGYPTALSTAVCPSTAGALVNSNFSICHMRKKSLEEMEYDRQAAIVVSQLQGNETYLCRVILPPPQHKTAADYMTGLFDTSPMQESSAFQRGGSTMRESVRQRVASKEGFNDICITGPRKQKTAGLNDAQLGNTSCNVSDNGREALLDSEKLELVARLEKKLEILRQEKRQVLHEIAENDSLGKRVTLLAEEKLQRKDFDKFRLYIDELDKVFYLLLRLSDRLAKADNAISELPQNASDKEKSTLIRRRDELVAKHADARQLKDGIDRRRAQVQACLQAVVNEQDMGDYDNFLRMKTALVVEQQEIDDMLALGETQLKILRMSLRASSSTDLGSEC